MSARWITLSWRGGAPPPLANAALFFLGGFCPLFAAPGGATPALAGLRVLRTCQKQVWWCRVGGGLAVSLHPITAFSLSRAARASTLAARGRLRPLTAARRRAGDGSGQFRPCNRRSS